MGNNESFPPPPPGNTPPPPPGQPQQPYYPPTQPQPQYQQPQYQQPAPGQYPTQQMPQQGGYPPQYGQMPPAMPPAAPKKKTGLIIGVGVVVVAAIVAAVVLLGGDDKKKASTGTDSPVTSANNGTIVLTVPGDTTIPVVNTDAPNTSLGDGDVIYATDDTGAFTVMVPSDMTYDTGSFDANGNTFARVAASYDLQAFFDGDDEYGWLVVVAGTETGFTAQSMLDGLSPSDGCASSTDRPTSPTMFGDAIVRIFEGCGTSGTSAKAILAVQDSATGKVIGFYAQGADSSSLEALVTVMIYTVTLN